MSGEEREREREEQYSAVVIDSNRETLSAFHLILSLGEGESLGINVHQFPWIALIVPTCLLPELLLETALNLCKSAYTILHQSVSLVAGVSRNKLFLSSPTDHLMDGRP